MSVCRDLRLYLRFLYLVGMLCARFDAERCLLQTTPHSERYAFLYTLGILAGTFGCFAYAYLSPESFYMRLYNKTGNVYENLNLRSFCLVLWLLYTCLYLRRQRYIALVQTLLQLNRLCSTDSTNRSFLRNFIIYKVLLMLCIFNYANGFAMTGLFTIPLLLFVIVYSYAFLAICLLLMFFVCLQQVVAAGLAHYNMQLKLSLSRSNCRRALFERQRLLGPITGELNECFGLLMLPIVPLVLFMAPTGPLYLISTVMEGKFSGFRQYAIGGITASLWNIPWLTMITFLMGSNDITVEANKTAKILAKIPRTGSGLDRMVEKFLLKNLRQQPILTAYGFFALDKSTLFKLFTAIFTYMVILVQFKEMENSTKSLQKT